MLQCNAMQAMRVCGVADVTGRVFRPSFLTLPLLSPLCPPSPPRSTACGGGCCTTGPTPRRSSTFTSPPSRHATLPCLALSCPHRDPPRTRFIDATNRPNQSINQSRMDGWMDGRPCVSLTPPTRCWRWWRGPSAPTCRWVGVACRRASSLAVCLSVNVGLLRLGAFFPGRVCAHVLYQDACCTHSPSFTSFHGDPSFFSVGLSFQGRRDTVRCIVTSLTDEGSGDLYEELRRQVGRQDARLHRALPSSHHASVCLSVSLLSLCVAS